MTLQTVSTLKKANQGNESRTDRHLEYDEDVALENVKSILVDVALDVGALIDAVCCRCGDWFDWEHYQLIPGISPGSHAVPSSIVRLVLAENDCGLRAGGYIEMCVLREERVIEASGGYYDACHQPRSAIDGTLRWHEVNHQSLGQALLLMYDRIIRAYMAREKFDDKLYPGQVDMVQGDWQLVEQPAGPLQNPIKERIWR